MAKLRHLAGEFVVLGPDLGASTIAVTETLWTEIDDPFGDFAGSSLVSTFAVDEPWPTREMHPAGEGSVYLPEEETDLMPAFPDGERNRRLAEPGQYRIVPRGAWHTARPKVATRPLLVTPGQGTENRERLPWDECQP